MENLIFDRIQADEIGLIFFRKYFKIFNKYLDWLLYKNSDNSDKRISRKDGKASFRPFKWIKVYFWKSGQIPRLLVPSPPHNDAPKSKNMKTG